MNDEEDGAEGDAKEEYGLVEVTAAMGNEVERGMLAMAPAPPLPPEEGPLCLNPYLELERGPLYEALRCGGIRLVRGRYLEECAERGRPWQMRQEIAEEHLWPPEEAAWMWRKYQSVFFVALSYSWLSKEHPDPELWHTRRLARIIREWRASASLWITKYFFLRMQTGADPAMPDLGIFVDFISLFQEDTSRNITRTEEQQVLFMAGMAQMNVVYGNVYTSVIRCCGVPATEPRKYMLRGWTLFESCVADSKAGSFLKLFTFGDTFDPELEEETSHRFFLKHQTGRSPPSSAELFQELLEHRAKEVQALPEPHNRLFTNGKDQPLVIAKYHDVWEQQRVGPELSYGGADWCDAQALALAVVLPSFSHLERLSVDKNNIGDTGIEAICAALPPLERLSLLYLSYNAIGVVGAKAVLDVLPRLGALTTLALDGNPLCANECVVEKIRLAWRCVGKDESKLGLKVQA